MADTLKFNDFNDEEKRGIFTKIGSSLLSQVALIRAGKDISMKKFNSPEHFVADTDASGHTLSSEHRFSEKTSDYANVLNENKHEKQEDAMRELFRDSREDPLLRPHVEKIQLKMASNPSMPNDILASLADCPFPSVQLALLDNPSLEMSNPNNPKWFVLYSIFKDLIAHGSDEVIEKLAQDKRLEFLTPYAFYEIGRYVSPEVAESLVKNGTLFIGEDDVRNRAEFIRGVEAKHGHLNKGPVLEKEGNRVEQNQRIESVLTENAVYEHPSEEALLARPNNR